MQMRALGRSGLAVSAIALGCAGFWGSRAFPERRAAALVEEALALGVNLLDTGRNYSNFNAEPRLGRILRPLLARHGRARVVISSKAGTLVPAGSLLPARWRRRQKDFSPDAIEQSCADSIRALDCGYLDIFQLHDAAPQDLTPALLDRLQRMRERGMFRLLGLYAHHDAQIEHIVRNPGLVDVVLLDYNVLRADREPLIAALHEAGVGVLAGTVLAQGHLVEERIRVPCSRADAWYLARAALKADARRTAHLARAARTRLAGIAGLTPARAALAWVLANPAVAACVVGTTDPANLRELVAAGAVQLSAADRAAITGP